MRIYQNYLKAKNFNFVTVRSHRIIINWLSNSMNIFISPISTLYFNPIQNRFNFTHVWDSAKSQFLTCKVLVHEKLLEFFNNFTSNKYQISVAFIMIIMSIRFLRANNSILETFVGFWKYFWKNICFNRGNDPLTRCLFPWFYL